MKSLKRYGKIYTVVIMFIMGVLMCAGCGNNKSNSASNPKEIFKEKFGFELPETAEYKESNLNGLNGYNAKIIIKTSDLYKVCEGLNKFYEKPAVKEEDRGEDYLVSIYSKERIEEYKRAIEWFDLEYEEIDTAYFRYKEGNEDEKGGRVKSVLYGVLLDNNNDDTVTMYVVVN